MKRKIVIAIIFPILPEHIQRIFDGKDVFCKYVGRGNPNISIGNHILFYASGKHEIPGEATISGIEYLSSKEVVEKYMSRLFIDKNELERYRISRDRSPEKRLLVLTLTNAFRYHEPLTPIKNVSMSGLTLSREEFKRQLILKKSNLSGDLRLPTGELQA
jgi:hypothetical protein